jgi:DNA-binding NarL/FixJ family response regulator
MIRILIADDHEVVAEGLKQLIEAQSDMQVVAIVGDGREAVRQVGELDPDVVIMDLSMPELNGADATRVILEQSAGRKVIVLSMYADHEYVRRALQSGALGYVVKRSAAKDVVEAIRSVHAGERYISPMVADAVSADAPAGKEDRLARLSTREREVLQLLAEGRTGTEIAQRLSLSPKTVETYRARLVEKLGIRDVAGLVRFAIQRGIISLD